MTRTAMQMRKEFWADKAAERARIERLERWERDFTVRIFAEVLRTR